MTCIPDIYRLNITRDMEFILMGCDGIWECVEKQKLCEFISSQLSKKVLISVILKEIFNTILPKNNRSIRILKKLSMVKTI